MQTKKSSRLSLSLASALALTAGLAGSYAPMADAALGPKAKLSQTAKQLGSATTLVKSYNQQKLALHVLSVHSNYSATELRSLRRGSGALARIAMLSRVTGMSLEDAETTLAEQSFGAAVADSGANLRHAQITMTAALAGMAANARIAADTLADTDGDGIPNAYDDDADGDGIANIDDEDVDGDGIVNGDDEDIDGDGIENAQDDDVDGDDDANNDDEDIDGDGLANADDEDEDGDGVINSADDDEDGDGTANADDDDDQGDDSQV